MIDSDGNETKTIYEAALLEELTELREELAALKAYNSELARTGKLIDHPMVSQLSEKWVDDFKSSLAKTPAQSLAKIRVDAIMSLRELGSWDGREDGEYYYSASTIKKFAEEIEDGL